MNLLFSDVYRVEGPNGLGAYSVLEDRGPLYDPDQHPDPEADGLYDFSHLHFGFRSLAKLREWFGPADTIDRNAMRDAHFYVAKYRVAENTIRDSLSEKQLVFSKPAATLTATWPVDIIWNPPNDAQV